MVPEGVLAPVPGGFRMYLQSNFAHRPGAGLRERFSIAHELVHTFYYDSTESVPKPIKGSPKGRALEQLCHIGAGEILVPEPLLRQQATARGEIASAESVRELTKIFNVSADVMIRRLHAAELVDDFAAILVETKDGNKRSIRAACYSSKLLCHAARPKFGVDFDSWVLPLLPCGENGTALEWKHTTPSATVSARKVRKSSRSFILDLRFGPASY